LTHGVISVWRKYFDIDLGRMRS